jgi:hypothetical protein
MHPGEYLEASGTYEMTPEQRVDWKAEVRSLYDDRVVQRRKSGDGPGGADSNPHRDR